MRYDRIILRFAALAVRHPTLLAPMLAAAWRFRSRRWWTRAPFLPLPPRNYLEWRLQTAFGSSDAVPEPAQLERYLRWTRESTRRTPEGP